MQELKWSQYLKGGQAVGNSCMLCLVTAITGFPGMTFDECAVKFHNIAEKEFKASFLTARARRAKLENGEKVAPIRPGSYVSHMHSMVRSVYYELAFCSQTEVENLTGLSVKEHKLKPVTMVVEDGTTLKGHFISLKGLDPAEVASVRRVRFEQQAAVVHDERLLEAADQLRQQQGTELYGVATTKHWDAVEAMPKPSARHQVPSFESLRAKAREAAVQESICGPIR